MELPVASILANLHRRYTSAFVFIEKIAKYSGEMRIVEESFRPLRNALCDDVHSKLSVPQLALRPSDYFQHVFNFNDVVIIHQPICCGWNRMPYTKSRSAIKVVCGVSWSRKRGLHAPTIE